MKTGGILWAVFVLGGVQFAQCFCLLGSRLFGRLRGRSDAWLESYDVIRVVTSNLHYLPSYLSQHGEAYGSVTGNATLRTLAKSGCEPSAMSASGVFELATPPEAFAQGRSRFNSHLHEGTCSEISNTGESTNGLGNHYQHIPVCPRYSYENYDNSPGCLNTEAPGGVSWRQPLFELWPTFYAAGESSKVWKVGALSEKAADLIDCPTACTRGRCTECQARAVPWWPVPGTTVSIVVHDTARAETGSGPVMLCADVTGLAVQKQACEDANINGCKDAAPKSSKFCSYSDTVALVEGAQVECIQG